MWDKPTFSEMEQANSTDPHPVENIGSSSVAHNFYAAACTCSLIELTFL